MNYYIQLKSLKRKTAASKAPDDIYKICEKLQMRPISFFNFPFSSNKWIKKVWLYTIAPMQWLGLFFRLRKDDYVVYQHPMFAHKLTAIMVEYIQKIKKCHFIVLIHDLESLRGGIANIIQYNEQRSKFSDYVMLDKFEFIICHNEKMKAYLIDSGIRESKLYTLGVFDYLCEDNKICRKIGEYPYVVIAGNLAKEKSGYIYSIDESSVKYNLYGINCEKDSLKSNMVYKGVFKPDELPNKLDGQFGLVWDGISSFSCVGNTGEYLKYNNPHKVSLYLASNLPVIIWREAALADFVVDHKLGFAVDSLEELEECLSELDEIAYKEMCANVEKIGEKIRRGYFFETVIEKIIITTH